MADYSGILLQSSQQVTLEYCNFEYAVSALSGFVNNFFSVAHSKFRYNTVGFYLSWCCTPRYLFDSCDFQYNMSGISSFGPGYFRNCIFKNNQIGLRDCYRVLVENCIIDSNLTSGIELTREDTVRFNEIKFNGTGITSGDGQTPAPLIYNNFIENNTIGVEVHYTFQQRIYCNKICNNTSYNIKYTYSINSDVIKDNFWCTTDSALIASSIYDGYDNLTLGLLDFMPLDTVQCYLTGCNLGVSANITNASCDTCHDGSASAIVANSFPPLTYTWYTSPIQSSQYAYGLSPGNYTICVTDANGCTACNSVFVDSTNCNNLAIQVYSSNATCNGCSDGMAWVTMTGGTAPYHYSWYTTPIQTTDTAMGLLHGNYTVCVSDLYGCSVCDSIGVSTGNCSAHFSLLPDTIQHHYIAVNMASGISPFTFSWNWGDGSPADTTAYPNHTYASSGFYSICQTITDFAGCTDTYCNSYYLLRSNNSMVYVSVIPEINTGISGVKRFNSISIVPNPVSEYLHLEFPPASSLMRLRIYSMIGEEKLTLFIHGAQEIVDVSSLTDGVYILALENKLQVSWTKFIMLHQQE